METFAQVSDKDVSDKSFIQYDASGKIIRTSSAEDLGQKASDFYDNV